VGEFPYWRVFSMIDGRYVVSGQGDREMPVWGQQFLEGDTQDYGTIGGPAVTTERIRQLTEYVSCFSDEISRIQRREPACG
jgi:hypothetical protein